VRRTSPSKCPSTTAGAASGAKRVTAREVVARKVENCCSSRISPVRVPTMSVVPASVSELMPDGSPLKPAHTQETLHASLVHTDGLAPHQVTSSQQMHRHTCTHTNGEHESIKRTYLTRAQSAQGDQRRKSKEWRQKGRGGLTWGASYVESRQRITRLSVAHDDVTILTTADDNRNAACRVRSCNHITVHTIAQHKQLNQERVCAYEPTVAPSTA
jgi:hypothetical protein